MTQTKAAPWVGGTLALTMSLISAIPASAQQQQLRPSQPFARGYAIDVAQGIERACRDTNYEIQNTNFRTRQDIQNWQETMHAKIYTLTKRMPPAVAEGYIGGAEKYLTVFAERLIQNVPVPEASRSALADCNQFLAKAQNVPTTDRGGFRAQPLEGAPVPKPKGW